MLFASWPFAILIAILLPVYYLIPKRMQSYALLAANMVFYVFAGWQALVLLLLTGISVYLFARWIGTVWEKQRAMLKEHKPDWTKEEKKIYRERMEKKRRWILAACLLIHFGILFWMKYGQGIIGYARNLTGKAFPAMTLLMTMGVSFYTFSAMGYVIDVYREKYPAEKRLTRVLLFTSFFPILVQGPISRFDKLGETLFQPHDCNRQDLEAGLLRVLWGYWKKLIVADRLLVAVRQLIRYPDTYQGAFALLGMLLYAATLYADFTGGIDITIGIGRMLGIRIEENFNRPYFSKGIAEYWRRWHMTLGTWFKEYLYYPVSVSRPLRKLTKSARRLGDGFARRLPVYIATIAVWVVTGMWHGSSWNFVVWGVLNGVIILISEELSPLYKRFHTRFPQLGRSWYYRGFQVIRTVLLLSALRMFDCYATVPETLRTFCSIFTVWNAPLLFRGGIASLGLGTGDWILAFFGICAMTLVSLRQRNGLLTTRFLAKPLALKLALFCGLLFTILIFGQYGFGFDASQFIYNRF